MDPVSPFQARWPWKPFLICHAIVIGLALLWLWPPTRAWMDGLDIMLFNTLSGSQVNETWLAFWGLLSTRPFDACVGIVLLTLMMRRDWLIPGDQARGALFAFVVLLLLLVIIRVLYTRLAHTMGWQHASLSMLQDNAIHLSDQFPH